MLLPLVVTDSIVLRTIKKQADKEQRISMNHAIERIEYNIQSAVNDCLTYARKLYSDRSIYDFLSKSYPTPQEYYESFYSFMNSRPFFTDVSIWEGITIYTHNESVLSGGNFINISSLAGIDWYQNWVKEGCPITVCPSCTRLPYTYYYGTGRMISILYPLNCYQSKGETDLIKIDLNYEKVLADVMNERFDGTVYVCDQDKIIFANKNVNSLERYKSRCDIDMKAIKFQNQMDVINQKWDILIETEDVSLWKELQSSKILLVLLLINILLPTIVLILIATSMTTRINLINEHMKKIKGEVFIPIHCHEGEDEIGNLIQTYNLMVHKIQSLIEDVYQKEMEKQMLEFSKKDAELKALQSQVNPHFLFNTLETIRMRSIIKGEDETANIIGELAMLFRSLIDWRDEYHTIREEMEFANRYLSVQKYRFGERIEFHSDIMEECLEIRIPKLSIVTFIENACIHGVEEAIGPCELNVTIKKEKEHLQITISDTGSGIEPKRLEQLRNDLQQADIKKLRNTNRTGMLNAYIRLTLQYHSEIDVKIDSEVSKGTTIQITIPIINQEN